MSQWPHDDNGSLVAFYGDPSDPSFERNNIVSVVPPFQIFYNGQPTHSIRIHKKCAVSLKLVLDAIWDAYGRNQAKLDATGFTRYSGSYENRMVRGSSSKISCHAVGAALDFNSAQNGLNTRGNMPEKIIDIFKAQGWFWGGDFKSRSDPMHFQAANEDPSYSLEAYQADTNQPPLAHEEEDDAPVPATTNDSGGNLPGLPELSAVSEHFSLAKSLWGKVKNKFVWTGGATTGGAAWYYDWRVVLAITIPIAICILAGWIYYDYRKHHK